VDMLVVNYHLYSAEQQAPRERCDIENDSLLESLVPRYGLHPCSHFANMPL